MYLYMYVSLSIHVCIGSWTSLKARWTTASPRLQVWLENRHQIPAEERDGPIKAAEWKREWRLGRWSFRSGSSMLIPLIYGKIPLFFEGEKYGKMDGFRLRVSLKPVH